ncbi:hypothetical protein [Halobacterium sp. R2-5]|uniref:DUF7096 domain-containing protein n=1 Tax=Halobacterium sp. R2-5 TaxID=2715751 RepID=UPI0014215491|nr:hypothetical protein [Halobacterium sp. R2-5]NIB98411.1 hypothetical protein [Halobacterium sp. R2-5]
MRATVLLVTALLVVGAGAPLAVAGVGDAPAATESSTVVQEDGTTNETDNETETAPGAQLAGVADVQAAEVEGEVERRAFGLQVAAANSNASKASVVAGQVENLDQRLAELRDRKQELETARENGTISESRYRAEMAGLAARISTLQGLTNETAETARGIPDEDLAERGVNATDLDRLRTSAGNLSGPEVAAIARSIAGPAGNGTAGPPFGGNSTMGPPTDTPASGNDNETGGPGAPDSPGGVENATNGNETDAPRPGDDLGNSSDASGDGPGANASADNETSDGPGRPDSPGNGNGQLFDLSVLTSLLP